MMQTLRGSIKGEYIQNSKTQYELNCIYFAFIDKIVFGFVIIKKGEIVEISDFDVI